MLVHWGEEGDEEHKWMSIQDWLMLCWQCLWNVAGGRPLPRKVEEQETTTKTLSAPVFHDHSPQKHPRMQANPCVCGVFFARMIAACCGYHGATGPTSDHTYLMERGSSLSRSKVHTRDILYPNERRGRKRQQATIRGDEKSCRAEEEETSSRLSARSPVKFRFPAAPVLPAHLHTGPLIYRGAVRPWARSVRLHTSCTQNPTYMSFLC